MKKFIFFKYLSFKIIIYFIIKCRSHHKGSYFYLLCNILMNSCINKNTYQWVNLISENAEICQAHNMSLEGIWLNVTFTQITNTVLNFLCLLFYLLEVLITLSVMLYCIPCSQSLTITNTTSHFQKLQLHFFKRHLTNNFCVTSMRSRIQMIKLFHIFHRFIWKMNHELFKPNKMFKFSFSYVMQMISFISNHPFFYKNTYF